MKCCLCNNEIEVQPISLWAEGHNAEPVKSGRCCSTCNYTVVLPARMKDVFPEMPEEHVKDITKKIREIESQSSEQ